MTNVRAGRARSLGMALALCVMGGVVGCGGSASETPWPVEPEGVDLGPEDEHKDRERRTQPPAPKPAAAPAEPGASKAKAPEEPKAP